jgi:hypothetical protein
VLAAQAGPLTRRPDQTAATPYLVRLLPQVVVVEVVAHADQGLKQA